MYTKCVDCKRVLTVNAYQRHYTAKHCDNKRTSRDDVVKSKPMATGDAAPCVCSKTTKCSCHPVKHYWCEVCACVRNMHHKPGVHDPTGKPCDPVVGI